MAVNNLFDGRSAVTMFFVLSGFVLTTNHLNDQKRPLYLIPFYTRRLTRIWLPWLAFFLVSLIAKNYLLLPAPETTPRISAHLASFWQLENSISDLAKQLIFKLHNSEKMLIPQDWSLGVELRASLVIPFFLLLIRIKWPLLLFAAICIGIFKPMGGYYYVSFIIGIFTAFIFNRSHRQSKSAFNSNLVILVGLLLYQVRWMHELAGVLPNFINEREVWIIGSVGCSLIILGALKVFAFRRFLENKTFTYLGRISYSLYLGQLIVLLCVAPWIVYLLNGFGLRSDGLVLIFTIPLVVAICVILADFGERYIEVPCIRLGKLLTHYLQKYTIISSIRC
jgi:peptidoglycan/LPS O-acetylase OafA/YrhL